MSAAEFSRRAGEAETGEALWRALDDRIDVHAPDGSVRASLAYADVRRVRFSEAPGRHQKGRVRLDIEGRGVDLTLTNMHFLERGKFEDRSDAFFAFARQAIGGVHAARPKTPFIYGERPELYLVMTVLTGLAALLLGLFVVVMPVEGVEPALLALGKSVLLVLMVPVMLGFALNERPRRFHPVRHLNAVLDGWY